MTGGTPAASGPAASGPASGPASGDAAEAAVLVVGFRMTGYAVARYLRQLGQPVIIVDDDPTEQRRRDADGLGAAFLGHPDEAELRRAVAACRLVVPSPGIPVRHPVYRLAAEAGVPVHSEMELGWERLEARVAARVAAGEAGDMAAGVAAGEAGGEAGGVAAGEAGGVAAGEAGGVAAGEAGGVAAGEAGGVAAGEAGGVAADDVRRPVLVAVTGTNGKTTVTTLVASMLVASGLVAVAAGNIGVPFVEAAALDVDVLVVEVSSFQLQFTEHFHPAVSCWLNLAEDHLDWHPTMAHYAAAKARIWAAQGSGDVAVVNADDAAVMDAACDPDHGLDAGVEKVTFSACVSPAVAGSSAAAVAGADFHVGDGGELVGPDGLQLLSISELPRALPFDIANDLAAVATALAAGASVEGCRAGLRQFQGLPHRVELVAERGGIRWYDDSKSTTPASVLAAVAGFGSVVLIAGGRNKGADLNVLGQGAPPVHGVVAVGEAAEEVEAAFSGRVPVARAETMAAAVSAAAGMVRAGDVVLLSPGCASFDRYRSYAERGDEFAASVAALVAAQGGKEAGAQAGLANEGSPQ